MTHPNYNPITRTHYGCIALATLDSPILDEIYNLSNPTIDLTLEPFDEFPEGYYEGITATIDGVTFEIFLIGGAYHLLVTDSPVWGYFTPCSPMLPNAGDLGTPDPQGIRTYSVPHTWFYMKEAQA